jgi:DNA topoisomerase-6 subunit A
MMALSKELVQTSDFATKRDAYYQSKNWGEAMFDEQGESDMVMDDIEAMFSVSGVSREQLRYIPDEHGGAVAGELVVNDTDLETGNVERIDCTKFGSGAYSIPSLVEHLTFETKAKFILCIETGGMFQRLQSHKFWQKSHCILVSMAGVPTRATRRFVRRLSDQCKLPVYAFVDCDPYGISNIYRTLKVGSGNAAHINRFFCVPQASFLGVTPNDIVEYKLPTHPLKDVDVKRAKDALKNDPFFKIHRPWAQAMEQLIKMGVRAEQQALARWGLNYVIDEYLPRKLKATNKFLP